MVNYWMHGDGSQCFTFSGAKTPQPSGGGNWWCLEHEQFLVWTGPTETTGEHTKAKLADDLYGGVTGDQAASAGAWNLSEMAHLGVSVPGVVQGQEPEDTSEQSGPPGVWYVPLFGWPVTRGPVKSYEWYLGASIIVSILTLFAFVRIFYIG